VRRREFIAGLVISFNEEVYMRNFLMTGALVAALLTTSSARADEPSEPSIMDWLTTSLLKKFPQANKDGVILDVSARTISFVLPDARMICQIDMYWDGRVNFSNCQVKS
jgi:hypothetical protein